MKIEAGIARGAGRKGMSDIVERLRHDAEKARRNWPEVFCVSEDPAEEAADEIEKLRAALRELIYETTHLSPQEDDGSHRCTITGETLRKARMALGEKE